MHVCAMYLIYSHITVLKLTTRFPAELKSKIPIETTTKVVESFRYLIALDVNKPLNTMRYYILGAGFRA